MSKILIKLLNKYDEPARDTTIKYIENTISNPDKYGVDVLLKDCLYIKNIEVQTLSYKSFIDTFKILTVFSRKARYSQNTLYITYNFNYSKCYIFCRCQLLETQTMKSKNKYSVNDTDKMYYLYKDDVLYIDKINNDTFNLDVIQKFFRSKNL